MSCTIHTLERCLSPPQHPTKQELLDILRVHAQKSYYSRLEAAVMWLVGVCAVVAVFQLIFLSFWKPSWRD